MGFDNKSDYARNKQTPDIVYFFADGEEVRFRKENSRIYRVVNGIVADELPEWEMSVAEFDRIKGISNGDYHERELHTKRVTREDVSIHNLAETDCVADRSAEQEFFDYLSELEAPPDIRSYENALSVLDECLTETQKRRFLLYHLGGKKYEEIAEMDGINVSAVWKSVTSCETRIKKYFSSPAQKRVKKRPVFWG